jgi:hypothetical protein
MILSDSRMRRCPLWHKRAAPKSGSTDSVVARDYPISLRRSTPTSPRMPEPNSMMLLGSGVVEVPPVIVNDSPPELHTEPPPGTITPNSKSQVAGPLFMSHASYPLPWLSVAFVRVSQYEPPATKEVRGRVNGTRKRRNRSLRRRYRR